MTAASAPPVADRTLIAAFLQTLVEPGAVHEVRIIDSRRTGSLRLGGTVSGYFNNVDACSATLAKVTGADAAAVYISLNPCHPDLLARAVNRLQPWAKTTTADQDIIRRRRFLLDCDPVRPTGISSTDAERDGAVAVRDRACEFLADMGWSRPLAVTMSGNGAGAVYAIDLPNTDESTALIEGVVNALADLFDTDEVTIDRKVGNASRLTKVAGTVAAVGDATADRPWRVATAVLSPDEPPVPLARIEAVAALRQSHTTDGDAGARDRRAPPSSGGRTWRIADKLRENGVGFTERTKSYATVYALDRCLTSSEHTDGAAILERGDGSLLYLCQHNSCQGKRWADARTALGLDRPVDEQTTRSNGHPGGHDAGPKAKSTTLPQVVATFRRWLHLDDDGALLVALGAVAANLMESDPVWQMLVGPPSSGKTEIINAVAGLPDVHLAATITEAALLSGTPKREKDAASKGGLLREIGDFGILVLKDFTSVLSMNRDQRAALLAALREVFDGSWTRHVGVDGGRTLHWEGKLGLIAGCTTTIDSHHTVMATMGERFLLFRLPEIDPEGQARRALGNIGRERAMRRELAEAVGGLFAGLDMPKEPLPMDDADTERLICLASLAARCRSAVERDTRSREIDLIPDAEAPARIAQTLRRLYGGLVGIGLDRAQAWGLIVKVGLDCMPKLRRACFDVLARDQGWQTTATVATAVRYPTNTARRSLEDMAVHGVVDRTAGGSGKPDTWRLSDWARATHAMTVPEMSEREYQGDQPPFNNPHRSYDDKTGTVGDSQRGSQDFGQTRYREEEADRRCWRCRRPVAGDEPCDVCGWRVCGACGACGCDDPTAKEKEG